jgi:hypothetical protein
MLVIADIFLQQRDSFFIAAKGNIVIFSFTEETT